MGLCRLKPAPVAVTHSQALRTIEMQTSSGLEFQFQLSWGCRLTSIGGMLLTDPHAALCAAPQVFLMTGVVAAGAIICASYSIPKAVEEIQQDGAGQGFTQFCETA